MASTATVTTTETITPTCRLPPAGRPGLLSRLLALYMRVVFGKVLSSITVLYPRLRGMAWGQLLLERYSQKGVSLDPHLKMLVELRISEQNGCTFCADIGRAMHLIHGGKDFPASLVTSDPEDPQHGSQTRALLRYVDELGRDRTVSDATFADLARHFSEKQVAEIVWLTSFTHYHNLMAKQLGLASEGLCEAVQARRRR